MLVVFHTWARLLAAMAADSVGACVHKMLVVSLLPFANNAKPAVIRKMTYSAQGWQVELQAFAILPAVSRAADALLSSGHMV